MFIFSYSSCSTKPIRRMIACAVLSVFVMATSSYGQQSALIVLSSEAKPYVEAAEACEATLGSAGFDLKRVLVTKMTKQQIESIDGVVIAIGGRASAIMVRDLDERVELYYCLAPSPGRIGLLKRAHTSGISADIEPSDQADVILKGIRSVHRVGVLYRSENPDSVRHYEAMRKASTGRFEIVAVDLDSAKSVSSGIKQLFRKKIDVVWTTADASVYNSSIIKALLLESMRSKTPVFGFSKAFVEAGAAFGVGIDPGAQGDYIAELIGRHETDTHVSACPMTAINLIAADRVSVSFSQSFIEQADTVYRP